MSHESPKLPRIVRVLLFAVLVCSARADDEAGEYQEKFMKRAIEISQEALTKPGTEPFGAVIVRNGEIVGEGLNQTLARFDVAAHGEIEAIRDASRRLKRLDLSDCEIYTTCEPCPLCVAAIDIARLRKMYYAAGRDQAKEAFAVLPPNGRYPVNVDQMFSDERTTVEKRSIPAEQKLSLESAEVLKAWALARRDTLKQ